MIILFTHNHLKHHIYDNLGRTGGSQLKTLLLLISLMGLLSFGFVLSSARKWNKHHFASPEVIVLLTGDLSRADYVIKFLKDQTGPKQTQLIISGYNASDYLSYIQERTPKLNLRQVYLENESQNTLENAIHVSSLLEEYLGKNIVIISSDYHILRVKLFFQMVSEFSLSFNYLGVPSKRAYSWWHEVRGVVFYYITNLSFKNLNINLI